MGNDGKGCIVLKFSVEHESASLAAKKLACVILLLQTKNVRSSVSEGHNAEHAPGLTHLREILKFPSPVSRSNGSGKQIMTTVVTRKISAKNMFDTHKLRNVDCTLNKGTIFKAQNGTRRCSVHKKVLSSVLPLSVSQASSNVRLDDSGIRGSTYQKLELSCSRSAQRHRGLI